MGLLEEIFTELTLYISTSNETATAFHNCKLHDNQEACKDRERLAKESTELLKNIHNKISKL